MLPDDVDLTSVLKPSTFTYLIKQVLHGWLVKAVETWPPEPRRIILNTAVLEKNARCGKSLLFFTPDGDKKILWFAWRPNDDTFHSLCDQLAPKYHVSSSSLRLHECEIASKYAFPADLAAKVQPCFAYIGCTPRAVLHCLGLPERAGCFSGIWRTENCGWNDGPLVSLQGDKPGHQAPPFLTPRRGDSQRCRLHLRRRAENGRLLHAHQTRLSDSLLLRPCRICHPSPRRSGRQRHLTPPPTRWPIRNNRRCSCKVHLSALCMHALRTLCMHALRPVLLCLVGVTTPQSLRILNGPKSPQWCSTCP